MSSSWTTVSPSPNTCQGASGRSLRPWRTHCLTLSPCISTLHPRKHFTTLNIADLVMNRTSGKTVLTLLQRTPASKSNCAAPYITSPLWRLSGTGNSLLCIAVLLSRAISALQSPRHSRFTLAIPDTGCQLMHPLICAVVLTFKAELAISVHYPHGTPGPGPASSHSPPVGVSRPDELFYWRKEGEWHLWVAARMRLRLVHESWGGWERCAVAWDSEKGNKALMWSFLKIKRYQN